MPIFEAIRAQMCMCVCVCMYVLHTHAHAHTHTHTHTHTGEARSGQDAEQDRFFGRGPPQAPETVETVIGFSTRFALGCSNKLELPANRCVS